MSEFIAAVTFGFIGLVALAALVYILGFVVSMIATIPYQLAAQVHLPHLHLPHHHRIALHH